MEEELKERIADATARICKQYEGMATLLASLSPSNAVLQQYKEHLTSTLRYAALHYEEASSIDLSACKLRHDPARLLSGIESRFEAQEQGFFALYPNAQFKTKIQSCFDATISDFAILENCLSAIS